jgi:HD-GYP domain-containing protein (c-di-GMP phosphodiesterase class II)
LAPNEAHPRNSLKYIGPYANNSDVIKIVEHHHENFDGSGPLGLVKKDIHPLSKILRVADAIIEKSNNSLLEGIQEALREDKNLYDKDCIESLLNHFKQKKVA